MDIIKEVLERVRSGITQSQNIPSQRNNEKEQKKKDYCNVCDGVGFIPITDSKGYTKYRPCKCRELVKAQKAWEQSGISINDIDKSFANFEAWNNDIKAMKSKVIGYYLEYDNIKRDRCNSIMLCGNPGSGKTHLSLALANDLLKKKQVAVVYMPYRDIITKLKQNMIDDEYYKNTISKYQNAELLLVDDLFKGKVNETDINIMFEIINHRYLNRLPIIVSTEYTVDKLLTFDEAIGSRLYEMSKNFIVQVEGRNNNYRMR